ncbi:origin recognition complex subunit 4 C-terminus-domain-containing protein [Lentinula detonsa]|uniref:Origin recognition complex subunit 4 C-terminus-domain-containing protein n=1 Tax=Lentinula detonsa TaxID=2804962 RepID=A0A9W8NUG1_9AGAR|nr:origin recognition complex subunit 4 C-terminus-domain-containing protein [Lentinula detonsa]
MVLKRKASSNAIQDSPSKRTRSRRAPLSPSLDAESPRKNRVAKRSVVVEDPSDDSSGDELDIINHDIPATPSRRSKKLVEVVVPTPGSSRKPAFPKPKTVQFTDALPPEPQPSPSKRTRIITYGKRETANYSMSSSPQKKNVQLKTPSLTPPPVHPPPVPIASPQRSPSRRVLKGSLPQHLHDSLTSQKRAVLHALQQPLIVPSADDSEYSTNEIAVKQLNGLLDGTVTRGEGNSCLLLGPRGSGKTQAIELCISNLKETPIVVRLSGLVQTNDRLAMREISRQLSAQVSPALLPEEIRGAANDESPKDDDNPFLDAPVEIVELSVPTAHMHSLIACIPTLGRPTIVILDAVDLFTNHPRQSLLYSLLDTVQSCRAGGGNKGMAVIGVTTRMDTLICLEKRVKSRFSGRMIRTSASIKASQAKKILRAVLMSTEKNEVDQEFSAMWNENVDEILTDPRITRILEEACSITGDIRSLARLFMSPVLNLKPASPWLTASQLEISAEVQRIRPEFPYLHTLNYPSLCLLIAFYQAENDGYPALTFEMLYEYVRNAIRVSAVAPVQLHGNSIGMVRCSRQVLWATFERLISAQIFVSLSGPSMNVGKNFLKYRCSVNREDVKKSVEKNGHSSLTKFLRRAMGSH